MVLAWATIAGQAADLGWWLPALALLALLIAIAALVGLAIADWMAFTGRSARRGYRHRRSAHERFATSVELQRRGADPSLAPAVRRVYHGAQPARPPTEEFLRDEPPVAPPPPAMAWPADDLPTRRPPPAAEAGLPTRRPPDPAPAAAEDDLLRDLLGL